MPFGRTGRIRIARAGAAAAALALFASAFAEERFVVPRPEGWKLALRASEGALTRVQFIPLHQNLDGWSDMVTSQTLPARIDVPVEEYLGRIAQAAQRVCEDVYVQLLPAGPRDAYPAAVMAQFCTRFQETGRGEVTLFKVIQGRDRLYVAHRSWRVQPFKRGASPVTRAEFDAWLAFLDGVRVCDAADPARPCPE